MLYELGLLPSGQLHYYPLNTASPSPDLDKIAGTFTKNATSEGLLALSSLASESGLSPGFLFWKSFSDLYMAKLCRLTHADQIISMEAPDEATYNHFISRLPPTKGAEYASSATLAIIWQQLDDFVRHEVSKHFDNDLAAFLKEKTPHWHETGRVCFHLAENKNDPHYPFAFMATYLPETSPQDKRKHQLLGKALEEYAGTKNKKRLIHLLSPVDRASQVSPLIKDLVDSGDIYYPLAWTPNEAYQFLQDATSFENCGIQIRLPDWWKKRPRPSVSVTLGGTTQKTFNASSLIEFDINLAIGDQQLTKQEWAQLLASEDKLVFLNKQWVEVDKEKLEQALSHWQKVEHEASEGISFIEGMRLLAGASAKLTNNETDTEEQQWSSIQASQQLGKLLKQMRHPDTLADARPGKALKATLRTYQTTGVNWLWHLNQLGLGACLADDMGLGKTIQIISLLLILKKSKTNKPSLIVLPTSLLGNWQEEINKFAPSLKQLTIHPSTLNKKAMEQHKENSSMSAYDVILTTYSMLLKQTWLFDQQWQTVVLDEAQAIKNPGSRQTKATKKLNAHARIALTGTPVENRLSDLWSLFDFICPGLLGSTAGFKKYTKSLDSNARDSYAPLRKLVQPYILRRLKTDKSIISDLPDKTEVHAYCNLSKQQATLYDKSVRDLTKKLEDAEGIGRRGLVLSYLLRFKQICNHPGQLLGDGNFDPKNSGKFARLAEICEEISSRQEKVLVFTQYREMCDPLVEFLSKCFQAPGLVLHGGVQVKQRQNLVQQFQKEDGPPFFVLSLKAGGTGLNLTAASHVIHFDRWWNPAVENQATDRAFRIGQNKNVMVHKFVCQGTIEERIDALINEKSALATDLLKGGSEKSLTEMSDNDLLKLVSLDLNKANAS